jgi:eukaryotic-like serine/threonine-protein kinase
MASSFDNRPLAGKVRPEMPRQDTSAPEESVASAITVELTVSDSPGDAVRVAPWTDVTGLSDRLADRMAEGKQEELPPLSPSVIPDAPVSVRPLRARQGHDDWGEIARGGMGAIRCVVDRRLLRQMALKTLPDGVRAESDAARRFVEEAQITGQLDHPNIVPVHELGQSDKGSLFFTMKLVRGKTLADVLIELGEERLVAQNLEHLVQIVVKVCDAISFSHDRGVVHRDLKPSNVMIGNYGQVYVMDWGLALLRAGPRLVSDDGKIIGTPGYMSPEQARGDEEIDERADVYGIGGLLYRILTGKRPHGGADRLAALRRTRERRVNDPRDVCPHAALPPELCRITMRALSFEREARYPTVAALQRELEQFLRGGGWLATRTYAPGTVIIEEGDEAAEAYIVVAGECEAYKTIGGARRSLRRMGPGEVFGETAVLTNKPRTASVMAIDEVTVKVVTRESLDRELSRNSFMAAFVHVLAQRFGELDQQLTEARAQKG